MTATSASSKTSSKIHAVDLFCGIGGLTHGLRLAGVDVRVGFDTDAACRYAFEANNDDAEFVCKDVHEVTVDELAPYYEGANATALVGCAPCQPFSAHNRRRPRSDDDCSLVGEFARLVEESTPDFVSMENVPGLARHEAFRAFISTLEGLGYDVTYDTVRCERFGVPQRRRRLVLLASRHGPVRLSETQEKPPTVGGCLRKLPRIDAGAADSADPAHAAMPLSPTNRRRIAHSKPGGTWKDWPDDLVNPCHRNTHYPAPYGRMRWNDLAPTITTQFCYYSTGRFGHPKQGRAISVREGAILQTFPTDYKLVDENDPPKVRDLARQVGNAVPVNLAKAIGEAFQECGA